MKEIIKAEPLENYELLLTFEDGEKKVKDMKGNPLLLFVNSWSVGMTLDRNENLKLEEFSKN